ncbi:MAG TPA: undecaprenyl-diphosphatase UppP [Anaerolineales bacterium]|nr:undecaprenyl-diphosphatase UppP [Anaerolineales bacterium]
MLIFQAIVLGIVQGLTEFIPISSSAHLIIVPWLLGWNDPVLTSLSFDVALHLGTLVAVVWFFASDWVRLIRAGLASLVERKIGLDPDRKLAWLLMIGCIPGGIAGVLGESRIDALFHQPGVPIKLTALIIMGIIIAAMALLLFIAERRARHTRDMNSLTLKDAILIGLAQALAIFPGVSRSGSTITAGMALSLKREAAARFSFLLSAPIILGAGLKSAWDMFMQYHAGASINPAELLLFPFGFGAAGVSGYFCIKYLLRYLQKNSTDPFVYYRWALAILIILVAMARG